MTETKGIWTPFHFSNGSKFVYQILADQNRIVQNPQTIFSTDALKSVRIA